MDQKILLLVAICLALAVCGSGVAYAEPGVGVWNERATWERVGPWYLSDESENSPLTDPVSSNSAVHCSWSCVCLVTQITKHFCIRTQPDGSRDTTSSYCVAMYPPPTAPPTAAEPIGSLSSEDHLVCGDTETQEGLCEDEYTDDCNHASEVLAGAVADCLNANNAACGPAPAGIFGSTVEQDSAVVHRSDESNP